MNSSNHKSVVPPVRRLCLLVTCIVLLALALPAQTFFGSIVGTVSDTSGAIIPGASVTLTSLGTSERRTAETNSSGFYQFLNLVPGRFKVEVEKAGFKHLTRDEVLVETQAAVRIDATMQIGEVGQTVEVTAQTPLLQAENSSIGTEVSQRAVNEMPLNGRNVLNLIELAAGAVPQG